MSRTRARIRRKVETSPGIHFNGLVRELDLAPGQVQYHLRRLHRTGHVETMSAYGRTHAFPHGTDSSEQLALALLHRETPRAIVEYVLDHGPLADRELAEALGLARSTLCYHRERLVDAGLLEQTRTGNGLTAVAVADDDATASMLARTRPTLPSRLAGRFERLVDELMEN